MRTMELTAKALWINLPSPAKPWCTPQRSHQWWRQHNNFLQQWLCQANHETNDSKAPSTSAKSSFKRQIQQWRKLSSSICTSRLHWPWYKNSKNRQSGQNHGFTDPGNLWWNHIVNKNNSSPMASLTLDFKISSRQTHGFIDLGSTPLNRLLQW